FIPAEYQNPSITSPTPIMTIRFRLLSNIRIHYLVREKIIYSKTNSDNGNYMFRAIHLSEDLRWEPYTNLCSTIRKMFFSEKFKSWFRLNLNSRYFENFLNGTTEKCISIFLKNIKPKFTVFRVMLRINTII